MTLASPKASVMVWIAWLLACHTATAETAPLLLDAEAAAGSSITVEVPDSAIVALTLINATKASVPTGNVRVELFPFRDPDGKVVPVAMNVGGHDARDIVGGATQAIGGPLVANEPMDDDGLRLLLKVSAGANLRKATGMVKGILKDGVPVLWKIELVWPTRVAEEKCRTATALATAGYRDEAKKLFQDALARADSETCARIGLQAWAPSATATPTPPVSGYEKVTGLADMGLIDKAWDQLNSEVVTDPRSFTADRKLSLGSAPWVCVRRIEASVSYYLAPTFKFLGGIFAVVALGWVPYLYLSSKRHPVLSIGAFVDSAAAGSDVAFPAAIETSLRQLGRAGKLDFQLAHGPVEDLQLPSDLAVPGSQFIAAIFKVLRVTRLELNGTLHLDAEHGAGVMLRLIREPGRHLMESGTIWESDIGLRAPQVASTEPAPAPIGAAAPAAPLAMSAAVDKSRYVRLAWAAAAWTYWRVYRQAGGNEDDLRRAFGTAHYQSYCNFHASDYTTPDRKTKYLENALIADADNRLALYSLAVLGLASGDSQGAERLFDRVIALSRTLTKKRVRRSRPRTFSVRPREALPDRVSILAHFQLGALRLSRYIKRRTPGAPAVPPDVKDLLESIEYLEWARTLVARATAGGPETDGFEVSDQFRDSLDITLAHALLLAANDAICGPPAPGDSRAAQLIAAVEVKPYLPELVHYNLACHYSDAVGILSMSDAQGEEFLGRSLLHLQIAARSNPTLVNDAQSDVWMQTLLRRTGTNERPTGTVVTIFRVAAEPPHGQAVWIVGDASELGGWNPSNATRLIRCPGESWAAILSLPGAKTIEYKYITKDHGGAVAWEGNGNRRFTTPQIDNAIRDDIWQP